MKSALHALAAGLGLGLANAAATFMAVPAAYHFGGDGAAIAALVLLPIGLTSLEVLALTAPAWRRVAPVEASRP